ncbi:hypothetical protein [Peribacillus sp. FSL E2-0159]|uniref:hypothetical protein n=1 Tax=Peribacillus sp. FSL E2-0159 TaxID=2975289 RepID=UPI003159CAF7
MNVELFMNDATDNFSTASGKETHYNDTWLGAKNMIHSPSSIDSDGNADGFMRINGEGSGSFINSSLEKRYTIREEEFGSLLLNQSNSKVYKLDPENT